ncbi:MAG: DUF4856 domain-containing protein [Crocinitomicaceae bacterium]|nr:DUF4856 domain-containing protein [Crocinitomicaceae bacterium]
MKFKLTILLAGFVLVTACKRKGCIDPSADNYDPDAEKDDATCVYSGLELPSIYAYTDSLGNSTVSYSGQTERLDQMDELMAYLRSGNANTLDAQVMNDMFSNTGGNGDGNFSFTSTKELKDKCFASDTSLIQGYFNDIAIASVDYAFTAESGLAGTANNSALTETYLLSSGGIEYAEVIEKTMMGAIFMYQATQVYFGDDKMNADNTMPVDPAAGKHYTEMEHHWDEAFGYFGVPVNFPSTTLGIRYWGIACNETGSGNNSRVMNHFKRGRAAIVAMDYLTRNNEIESIIERWEEIAAENAYIQVKAAKNAHNDFLTFADGEYFHALSMAYGYIQSLKYLPVSTRQISFTQIEDLLDNKIGNNFWNTTWASLDDAEDQLDNIYNF